MDEHQAGKDGEGHLEDWDIDICVCISVYKIDN